MHAYVVLACCISQLSDVRMLADDKPRKQPPEWFANSLHKANRIIRGMIMLTAFGWKATQYNIWTDPKNNTWELSP